MHTAVDDDALHALVVQGVTRILRAEPAEDVVTALLRANRGLRDAARGVLARRIHGVACLQLRLMHLAQSTAPAALVQAYVSDVEEGNVPKISWPSDARARLSVERSCPLHLVDQLLAQWPVTRVDAFLAACNTPGPIMLRANTLRAPISAVQSALAAEGIFTARGVHVDTALVVKEWTAPTGRPGLNNTAAFRGGLFEVQDEGSQAVAAACDAVPDTVVVDFCAGRGGKTLALAASMQNRGALFVHDVDARALRDMQPRLLRAGVTCSVAGLPPAGSADVVLVDAPCSSTGTWRRSSDRRHRLHGDDIAACVVVQQTLLLEAARYVRPGGRLVYATCSVLERENGAIVAAAPAGLTLLHARTLTPDVDGTDGFFIATLQRSA